MQITAPSIDQVREALKPLSMKQLERLEELSGVPATTIYKIKLGVTTNPGIETVGQFLPHIDAAKAADLPAPEPATAGS